MGIARTAALRIVRVISSIFGFIIPLFMTSSFLLPAGTPFGTIFSFTQFQSLLNEYPLLSPYAQYLPFLAGGGGGIAVWLILSQILGRVESALASGSMPKINPASMMDPSMGDMSKFMSQFNFATNVPTNIVQPEKKLPPDITKTQFMIITSIHRGLRKSKEIAKSLSMDKEEIEKEISTLVINGYLTKKNALTSKGLELLL